METIFDHNITEKEIEFITGFPNTTKEIYLSYRSDWGIYTDLYYLYRYRKNKEKADYYYNLIPDSTDKAFSIGKFDIPIFDD